MKREKLLEYVSFYNPNPEVDALSENFKESLNLPTDQKLLRLNSLVEQIDEVIRQIKFDDFIRRCQNNVTAKYVAFFGSVAACTVLGGVLISTLSGASVAHIIGGTPFSVALGAVVGFFGAEITGKFYPAKYSGFSAEMKDAFKTGWKNAKTLKKEIDLAFDKTSAEMTAEVCNSSPLREQLLTTFPRLKLDMIALEMKAKKSFNKASGPYQPVAAPTDVCAAQNSPRPWA